jgi:Spy/CpxP family protein refolding chaperone
MKLKNFMITMSMGAAIAIGGIAYAGGGMGGSGPGGTGSSGSGMMGGGGYGMMGSGGHGGMMGSGQGFFSPRGTQPQRSPSYQYEQRQTEKLREEIREKRQELSRLYRSEKPDKELMDQKMAELNRLEAELDYEMPPN